MLRVMAVAQPFLFVKSDEYRGRNVPVALSIAVSAMKLKGAAPVLLTSNSTHQPSSGQLSIPL